MSAEAKVVSALAVGLVLAGLTPAGPKPPDSLNIPTPPTAGDPGAGSFPTGDARGPRLGEFRAASGSHAAPAQATPSGSPPVGAAVFTLDRISPTTAPAGFTPGGRLSSPSSGDDLNRAAAADPPAAFSTCFSSPARAPPRPC